MLKKKKQLKKEEKIVERKCTTTIGFQRWKIASIAGSTMFCYTGESDPCWVLTFFSQSAKPWTQPATGSDIDGHLTRKPLSAQTGSGLVQTLAINSLHPGRIAPLLLMRSFMSLESSCFANQPHAENVPSVWDQIQSGKEAKTWEFLLFLVVGVWVQFLWNRGDAVFSGSQYKKKMWVGVHVLK